MPQLYFILNIQGFAANVSANYTTQYTLKEDQLSSEQFPVGIKVTRQGVVTLKGRHRVRHVHSVLDQQVHNQQRTDLKHQSKYNDLF